MTNPPENIPIATIGLLVRAKWSPVTFQRLIDSAIGGVDEICVAVDQGAEPGIEGYRASESIRYYQRDARFNAAGQRNFLDAQTAMKWRLHMDGDENLTPWLWSRLRAIVDSTVEDAISIARRNQIADSPDPVRHDWWMWPDRHVRCYAGGENIAWVGRIHEVVHGYKSVRHLPDIDRYAIQHVKTAAMQERSDQYREEAVACAAQPVDVLKSQSENP